MAIDKQCCCSKEPTGYVPIGRVLEKVDALAAQNDREGIERVLSYWEKEARTLGDDKGLLEILSEQIGLYRRSDEEQKGLAAVHEALQLLEEEFEEESVPNATIYLNCATTLKAFRRLDEAMGLYEKARSVYERLLPPTDYKLAGFYNNYATALADLGRQQEAEDCYRKAIAVLKSEDYHPEAAISYVNIAQLKYDCYMKAHPDDEALDDATEQAVESCLDDAYAHLEAAAQRDGNFASVCAKCAPVFGFFGYFMQKSELEKWADAIYRANTRK